NLEYDFCFYHLCNLRNLRMSQCKSDLTPFKNSIHPQITQIQEDCRSQISYFKIFQNQKPKTRNQKPETRNQKPETKANKTINENDHSSPGSKVRNPDAIKQARVQRSCSGHSSARDRREYHDLQRR